MSRTAGASYDLRPGEHSRHLLHITIPDSCPPGLFPVGGRTEYNGTAVHEIHTQRINVVVQP